MGNATIGFGDQVRVLATGETEVAGIAGLEGEVHGLTTPSVSGVEVVGGAPDDSALHVYFGGKPEGRWIRPDLLELLHHNAGAEMTVQGSRVKFVRRADGGWDEVSVSGPNFFSRVREWFGHR
jgi:hypothetical protein